MTRNFVGTLEAQKIILDDETNELRGIIHPVRRCSAEVLTLIFGMTTTPIRAGDSIKAYHAHTRQIYQIMGVCRDWRDAALHCPTMWTAIPIRLDTPLSDIRSLRKSYVERVKHVPVSICLSNPGFQATNEPGNTSRDRMRQCTSALDICYMERVPFISNLRLESPLLDEGAWSWLSHLTHFPSGTVESLSALGDWSGSLDPPIAWWSWDNFLRQFPPLTNLEVQGAREFILDGDNNFPTVERLTLKHLKRSSVHDTLTRFPNVKVLHFGPIAEPRMTDLGTEIELPCLTSLSVEGNGCIPWASPILAPNLNSFCLVGYDTRLDEACGTFLDSCPLLISVKLSGSDNLHSLILLTDRLVHLSLELYELVELFVEWWDSPLPGQPFPQLKTLALNYTMSPPSTTPTFHYFNDLVALRCLPHSNVKTRLEPSLSPLEVLAITHPAETPCAWMDSIYYETATTQIIKRDPGHISVTLSWVLWHAVITQRAPILP